MKIIRTGGNGRRSMGAEHNGIIYTSGITASGIEGSFEEQALEVLAQIDNILRRHGSQKENVLKATIYLADMSNYGALNAVWDEWVIDAFEPVREVVCAGLALEEYKLKISVVAAK